MKIGPSALLLLALLKFAHAGPPEGQPIFGFNPASLLESMVPSHVKIDLSQQTDPNNILSRSLNIAYSGSAPLQWRLFTWTQGLGSISLSTHHYAITGEVSYEDVSPGSYLEMWSYFASPAPGYPEGAYFSRTLGDGGPMGKLDGTSDWREFRLPFDSTGTTSEFKRVEMSLHLTGPGTVHLRNMMLVQYPDAPRPANVLASSGLVSVATDPTAAQPPHANSFDLRSFLFGALTTAAVLFVITFGIFISRLWQRKQHERELRRIASLDS